MLKDKELIRVSGYDVYKVESSEEMKELILSINRPETGKHEIYESYLLDDEIYHVNRDSLGVLYLSVEAVEYDEIFCGVTHYTLSLEAL